MENASQGETLVPDPGNMSLTAEPGRGQAWAADSMKLLGQGELANALHYLNLCLDDDFRRKVLNASDDASPANVPVESKRKSQKEKPSKPFLSLEDLGISPTEELNLLEKRCLIHMKLKNFDSVLEDARRILDRRGDHSLAYKCLLVSLCKTNRLEQVIEILKLWQTYSPKDLDMIESRTKLNGLMLAVKNGIEPADAFSNVEDLLGMSYDWLLARKSQDPQWKHRSVPPGQNSFVLCLPFRFGHCSLGEKCPDAHGESELEEWKSRSVIKSVTMLLDSIKLDSGTIYVRKMLEKLADVPDSRSVMTDAPIEGIKIKCSKPLDTTLQSRKMGNFKWTFAVETKKPLTHICLLYELHRQYFLIGSATLRGTNDKIDLFSGNKSENKSQILEISSPTALALTGKKSGSFTYKIDVLFKPDVFGIFRQTIVFDFGEDVKAMRNVSVDVVPPPEKNVSEAGGEDSLDRSSSPTFDQSQGGSYRAGVTWNFGNADVVDGETGDKVPSKKLGFALINGASNKIDLTAFSLKEVFSLESYKEKMRFFLTQEERARQEILAKYNVTAHLNMVETYVMTGGFNEGLTKYSLDGTLFGRMTLFRDVSEDTAVGRLILRSCNFLLLTKTEEARKGDSNSKPRVYFCPISDKTKNAVYVDLGRRVVSELGLKHGEVSSFEIQFQLDRTSFMEMKAVIDKLQEFHLDMLFPDFTKNYHIPWSPIKQWDIELDTNVKLNPRQKEALIAITAENTRTPPILVIGPFGTGKTFTLAQCIRKLLSQDNTRIMVCTHSNSAADLYIKEYLDPWFEEGFLPARPLRIYYELRNLNSVHPTVIQYCKIEKLRFRPPTVEELLAHRVIVVTLSTSYLLMHMDLPKDTFSHILLDEAAQAMESEAITPLMSAGEYTKLVLAGDHMQLSPELFSEEAKSLHPSLLERLHNSYPDNHPCKLMLCENYRSHSSIIQFVSDAFYTKKLECGMVQPVHNSLYPLSFFAARGEEVQDTDSTSYYNMAEVFEVAEKVSQLVSSWPAKWGDCRSENAIGVLTPYSDQVARIRSRLRKKGLYSVSVERVLNVQGKQFRAVFLSTVRSFRPWVRILPEAVGNEVDLGFFSNPKLLNTALTRAQSLVAVIGDPVSLCSVGKCRGLWKDFLTACHKNKSLHGISYTQLEQNILGVEMRLTWGLNPLASEFEPQAAPKAPSANKKNAGKGVLYQAFKSSTQQGVGHPNFTKGGQVASSVAPAVTSNVSSTQGSIVGKANSPHMPHPVPPQQRNIAPGFGPGHGVPMGPSQLPQQGGVPFPGPPGGWAQGRGVPVVPLPMQPSPLPFNGYFPPGHRPNPNAVMYGPHGFPHHRPGPGMMGVGLPPPPIVPLAAAAVAFPMGPPGPPRILRPTVPRPIPYSSNVPPPTHQNINGHFHQASFPPLPQQQAQQGANNPPPQVPVSKQLSNYNPQFAGMYNNQQDPRQSNISPYGVQGSPVPQQPQSSSGAQTNAGHEMYATGVPLYRRNQPINQQPPVPGVQPPPPSQQHGGPSSHSLQSRNVGNGPTQNQPNQLLQQEEGGLKGSSSIHQLNQLSQLNQNNQLAQQASLLSGLDDDNQMNFSQEDVLMLNQLLESFSSANNEPMGENMLGNNGGGRGPSRTTVQDLINNSEMLNSYGSTAAALLQDNSDPTGLFAGIQLAEMERLDFSGSQQGFGQGYNSSSLMSHRQANLPIEQAVDEIWATFGGGGGLDASKFDNYNDFSATGGLSKATDILLANSTGGNLNNSIFNDNSGFHSSSSHSANNYPSQQGGYGSSSASSLGYNPQQEMNALRVRQHQIQSDGYKANLWGREEFPYSEGMMVNNQQSGSGNPDGGRNSSTGLNISSDFGMLTAQLSGGEGGYHQSLYNRNASHQGVVEQDNSGKGEGSSGGSAGRSYANVVKHAPSTGAVGSGSSSQNPNSSGGLSALGGTISLGGLSSRGNYSPYQQNQQVSAAAAAYYFQQQQSNPSLQQSQRHSHLQFPMLQAHLSADAQLRQMNKNP